MKFVEFFFFLVCGLIFGVFIVVVVESKGLRACVRACLRSLRAFFLMFFVVCYHERFVQ